MEIEAIYTKGRLEFLQPVRLLTDKIRVRVVIPDHEVDHQGQSTYVAEVKASVPQRVREESRKMRARLDQIRSAPLPQDDELPDLTQKQKERIEAFALREELKGKR